MAILLNGWILPIGGASAVEGLLLTGPTPSSLGALQDLESSKKVQYSLFYD